MFALLVLSNFNLFLQFRPILEHELIPQLVASQLAIKLAKHVPEPIDGHFEAEERLLLILDRASPVAEAML